MDATIFFTCSPETAGLPKGRMAKAMSFIGLSSAAVRLELIFPQITQRWMMAHSPFLLTHTLMGSMRP